MLGLAIPEYGRLVWPHMVWLPWGYAEKRSESDEGSETYYTNLVCGSAQTLKAYNACDENKSVSYAVGYAHSFERMVSDGENSRGISAGSWYLPHPSECEMILFPYYNKLKYAASLLGETITDEIWTSSDSIYPRKDLAFRFSAIAGNLTDVSKANQYGVLLMAKMPLYLQQPTT